MKIYTKKGDGGSCILATGMVVSKCSRRVDCYGTVDELNSWLGFVDSLITTLPTEKQKNIKNALLGIRKELFTLGTDLSTPLSERSDNFIEVEASMVLDLEFLIDLFEADIPPLAHFILTGGPQISSALHIARTVCRRAERLCVALQAEEQINKNVVPFLNRLSDLLFVLARWTVFMLNETEIIKDNVLSLSAIVKEIKFGKREF